MQPLIVVGDYMDFKSLAAPKTFDFEPYANVPLIEISISSRCG